MPDVPHEELALLLLDAWDWVVLKTSNTRKLTYRKVSLLLACENGGPQVLRPDCFHPRQMWTQGRPCWSIGRHNQETVAPLHRWRVEAGALKDTCDDPKRVALLSH